MANPTTTDTEKATALYEDAPQGCDWCAALCPDHAGDFIDALAAALVARERETWDKAIAACQSVQHGTAFLASSSMGRDRLLNERVVGAAECVAALEAARNERNEG